MLLSSTSSPCLLSMTFSHVSTKHSLDSGNSGSFGNLVVSNNLCLSQARQFVVVLLLISLSVLMVYSIISSDCPFTACLYTEYIISEEIGLNLLSPLLQCSSVRGTCCCIFFPRLALLVFVQYFPSVSVCLSLYILYCVIRLALLFFVLFCKSVLGGHCTRFSFSSCLNVLS